MALGSRPFHDDVLSYCRTFMYRVREPSSFIDGERGPRPIIGYPDQASFVIPGTTIDRLNSLDGRREIKKGKIKAMPCKPANLLEYLANRRVSVTGLEAHVLKSIDDLG